MRWSSPRAIPFCFVVRQSGLIAEKQHHLFRDRVVEYLLGWVLQSVGTGLDTVAVRIFAERFSPEQPKEDTVAAQRILAHAALSNPDRFRRWRINEWRWADKPEAFVPYGDLLAYMPLAVARDLIGDWAQYENLPGYVRFDLDLVPMLGSLDSLGQSHDVNLVLNLIPMLERNWIGPTVLNQAGAVIRSNPALQAKLLREIESRFRDPARNLDLLTLQVKAIRESHPAATSGDFPCAKSNFCGPQ